jgi:hypothetical protein
MLVSVGRFVRLARVILSVTMALDVTGKSDPFPSQSETGFAKTGMSEAYRERNQAT